VAPALRATDFGVSPAENNYIGRETLVPMDRGLGARIHRPLMSTRPATRFTLRTRPGLVPDPLLEYYCPGVGWEPRIRGPSNLPALPPPSYYIEIDSRSLRACNGFPPPGTVIPIGRDVTPSRLAGRRGLGNRRETDIRRDIGGPSPDWIRRVGERGRYVQREGGSQRTHNLAPGRRFNEGARFTLRTPWTCNAGTCAERVDSVPLTRPPWGHGKRR